MSTSSTCLILARFQPVWDCITSTKTFLFIFARSVLSLLLARLHKDFSLFDLSVLVLNFLFAAQDLFCHRSPLFFTRGQ
jgi:hypothetical protein